ncbi:MAG: hypothetical protein QNJ98_12565 [Planctomycetota bacterium]|nr:hypothetical protein [Planctomycetota bacterium]
MTRLGPLPTLIFAALALTLTACGGGGGGIDEFATGDDPGNVPPTITIQNGSPGTTITRVYFYEAYTGDTLYADDRIGSTPQGYGGFNVSQYDIYVEYSDGHRSYSGNTSTSDPYNGAPIGRGIPRVNPGENAVVTMFY